MADVVPAAPPPPLRWGVATTGAIAFAVVTWIALSLYVLKLQAYFVALLLFWFWTTVGKSDFQKLPAAILGALVGIGLIWTLRIVSPLFGGWGLAVGGGLIAVAVLIDVMKWAPLVFNGCTLLFTTVAGIPTLSGGANFVEAGVALLVGAAYLSAVAWLAIWLAGAVQSLGQAKARS